MTADAVLTLEGVSRWFGGLRAVDALGLEVRRGEIMGLLGPNGSGKTTALNLISGALRPDAGRIVFEGRDIAGEPPHRIARLGIARTFQLVRVFKSMTARENVRAGALFTGRTPHGADVDVMVDRLLARVGIPEHASRLAGELTYIDQKRLELARALASSPTMLLLDEWLAGLNPTELAVALELIGSLRGGQVSILMVEHVMDAIRSVCDRCVVMNAGAKIAEGPPPAVLADPQVIVAYLGDDRA
ncbi:MAG: ABC transporter ATP-binding protein [Burkholderiales bacterium]|nr:MAG: ABC transporter ATP-binding protein [Burkholderiales bacterium]